MAEPTTTITTTEQDPIHRPSPQKTTSSFKSSWGTLEDLLLTCAVNRHGTTSWTSIANELNNNRRTSLFTPHLCRLKFLDLKHRFSAEETIADDGDAAVWLDELRRLRVAELKRDLHRYDLSIVSLQLKVKRLKEEREKSITKAVDENSKEDGFVERENSDLKKNVESETFLLENGRRNDESSNESNCTVPKSEPVIEQVEPEPDREVEPVRENDSCNGSSNSKESGPGAMEQVERVDSGELGESASDVQSTASLRRREKMKREVCGNSSGEENQSLGSKFSSGEGKSQSLVDFLEVVRTRMCGSVFESRLESQETPRYKSLIKEHIDLGIIQKRVEEGQYANCHTAFYRDLMLLVNNAIVFFSKRSSEHKFATELRQLVTQHFRTHLNIKNGQILTTTPSATSPKLTTPEIDQVNHTDLKPKLAITGPVIACRKRSSIAGKLSSSEAEKKESSPATVKPDTSVELKKDDNSSSTSFNAVTKKRTRDQNSGPRNPTSKNQNSHPSPTQKPSPRIVSSKGETSEAKTDIKRLSVGNSKQGSRPGKDLLLDVLDSAVKRKIFGNGSSTGIIRSDRHKDQGRGSHSGLNRKPSTEKEKGEERESSRNKNTGRPPKKAVAVAVPAKRGRDSGRDSDAHTKKRQRR